MRENDYLLGRLDAIERLIDFLCDAAGPNGKNAVAAAKRRAVKMRKSAGGR